MYNIHWRVIKWVLDQFKSVNASVNADSQCEQGLNVIITTRKRSLRRLCFYTCLSVILFRGGCLNQCILVYTHPGSRHPLSRCHVWEQTPPRADTPCAVHAGRYGQQASGRHPTGMHTCSNCTFERKIKTSLCGIRGWKHTRIFLQNSTEFNRTTTAWKSLSFNTWQLPSPGQQPIVDDLFSATCSTI